MGERQAGAVTRALRASPGSPAGDCGAPGVCLWVAVRTAGSPWGRPPQPPQALGPVFGKAAVSSLVRVLTWTQVPLGGVRGAGCRCSVSERAAGLPPGGLSSPAPALVRVRPLQSLALHLLGGSGRCPVTPLPVSTCTSQWPAPLHGPVRRPLGCPSLPAARRAVWFLTAASWAQSLCSRPL